ncbi:MAG TPA: hypothetical protein VEZ90_19455 [Blastocatellia bacterium]|nr:hypothetical protein [Blastocatellia bacterium]
MIQSFFGLQSKQARLDPESRTRFVAVYSELQETRGESCFRRVGNIKSVVIIGGVSFPIVHFGT